MKGTLVLLHFSKSIRKHFGLEVKLLGSYIYTNVQNAIGGSSASSGFQKNWSPNKIRALFIMRSFILVVDYLTGPKLIPLNQDEVGADLQNMSRVGSLNNLLSSRQLSCLEEIYADEVFSRYPSVLDLKSYADSVVNSASRLRYYAYTVIADGKALASKYYEAFSQGVVDFTYARSIGGIRVVDTGNSDWYKKHNLRPQYYGPDAENGSLAVWFRKVEKAVAEVAEKQQSSQRVVNNQNFIRSRILADLKYTMELSFLRYLLDHCRYAKDSFGLKHAFYEAAKKGMRAKYPIPGLSQPIIIKVAQQIDSSSEFATSMQHICSLYRLCELYLSEVAFDLQKLSEDAVKSTEDGFLNTAVMLDKILASAYESLSTNPQYKYTVNMAIQKAFPKGVPDGALAKRLQNRAPVISTPLKECVDSYMLALYEMTGVSGRHLISTANRRAANG